MPQSGAQLESLERTIRRQSSTRWTAAGLRSSFTKYLVYYDGPVSDSNVCGQGGSDPSGFGLAVVYYQACTGVSTAAVAVHEVVHTLGAVPRGAPNECSGEDSGHTCDNATDLLYPSIGDEPLSAKALDPGRDDYYGHAGAWPDTQDSPWLVRLDSQAPFALSVSGPGSVSADVPGLQCAQSCSTTWNSGTRLALTATPNPGAKLVRWGAACVGSAGCTVTVGSGSSLSALFAPATFRPGRACLGAGRGAQLPFGDHVPPPMLGDVPLVLAGHAHGDGREGLEVSYLERRLPWIEALLHGADDGSGERAGSFRSSLTFYREGQD